MAKILVVDDENKIRNLYKKLLISERYEVVEAQDSQSATRLMLNQPDITLVLLDINMPDIDGTVLYQLIRRLDQHTKVIVTSAYPLQDQRRLIFRADDYYDKSQGTEVLLEKVKGVLQEEESNGHKPA